MGSAVERIRLTDVLPEPLSHYADAVLAGDTMWVSGLLGTDPTGAIVGADDPAAQAEQIFRNLKHLLDRVDATIADVVKVVVYLRRIADREAVNTVRKRHFGPSRPASTLIEVSALAIPEALVEIEAVVYLRVRR